ncbi:TPA: hypothetical protein ACGO9Z_001431 [Streptococcus suis]|nr:hypothetical protein [Streptococcus suis]
MDETENILKSMRRRKQMVKERKKALSKLKATNLRQYNQLPEVSFPTLFVMIDGFDSVMDAPFSDAFYDVINLIDRDGASLGIYLVTALSRLNAPCDFSSSPTLRLRFPSSCLTIVTCQVLSVVPTFLWTKSRVEPSLSWMRLSSSK